MPTYEYRCPEGHQFELFQKMSDEPTAACPTCGAAGERILSGGAGFLFKGDGFYITDHRSDGYKKEASKESSDSTLDTAASGSKGSAENGGTESSKNGGAPAKDSAAKEGT
jgi:putative FmdB family regulatory protein